MWAAIINMLSGGALTALGGVASGIATRYFDLKKQDKDLAKYAQDNAHELEMKKLDIETMKAEATSNFKIEEMKASALIAASDADLQKAGYSFEPQAYADKSKLTVGQNRLFVWLDVIRGLVRPSVTWLLMIGLGVAGGYCIEVMRREGMTANPEDAYNLLQRIVNAYIQAFMFAMGFYFSTRNKASEAKARGGYGG